MSAHSDQGLAADDLDSEDGPVSGGKTARMASLPDG
jgi:hypothetical protein